MSFNGIVRMRALEIEPELIELIQEKGAHGLTFREGADALDMPDNEFRGAVLELQSLGRVRVAMSRFGHRNCIVLPDQEDPSKTLLTEKQRQVLDLLCKEADENGIVQMSRRYIKHKTKSSCPTFVLDRLDIKGYLMFLDVGDSKTASLFKVFPHGDGPKGSSWWYKSRHPPAWEVANWLQEIDNSMRGD